MTNKFTLLILITLSLVSPSILQAAEGDTYNFSWLDPDKEVYVLQNRKYRKDGKLHINLGAGTTVSGAFVDANTLQARIGYFFLENWGIEFIYAKNKGKENATARSLRSDGAAGSRPFRRIVDDYQAGLLYWSPFYSKVNAFNAIIYMDWLIGVGIAKLAETNNREEFETSSNNAVLSSETHNGIAWDFGTKIYISEGWEFRIDLTTIHYKAKKASVNDQSEEWYSNWDVAGSFGYRF